MDDGAPGVNRSLLARVNGTRPAPVDPRREDGARNPGRPASTGKYAKRRTGTSGVLVVDAPDSEQGIARSVIVDTITADAELDTAVIEAPEITRTEPITEVDVEAPTQREAIPLVREQPPTEPVEVEEPVEQPTEVAPIVYDDAATIDDPSLIGPKLAPRPLRLPVRIRRRTRPRVRRVTRVIRHVDTWSVFKVALLFNVFLYAVCLTAGVLLWQVATSTGTIDNVEKFFEGFGWETFTLNGKQIFHNAWIGGLFVAVGLTGLAVLVATLFNLITDIVGGVRVTVLEQEVLARSVRGTERPEQRPQLALHDAPPIDVPTVDVGVAGEAHDPVDDTAAHGWRIDEAG